LVISSVGIKSEGKYNFAIANGNKNSSVGNALKSFFAGNYSIHVFRFDQNGYASKLTA
jgi:hypothetical protein